MESHGAVFLPAAGSRGYYWSSSAHGNDNAYYLVFDSYGVHTGGYYYDGRDDGRSVRLVQDVE